MAKQKFSTNCGTQLIAGVLFCPSCGKSVTTVEPLGAEADRYKREVEEILYQAGELGSIHDPPLRSYSSTCSATQPEGLGVYSFMVSSPRLASSQVTDYKQTERKHYLHTFFLSCRYHR